MANATKTAKDTATKTTTPSAETLQPTPGAGSEQALPAMPGSVSPVTAGTAGDGTTTTQGSDLGDACPLSGTATDGGVVMADGVGGIPQFATMEELAAIHQRLDEIAAGSASVEPEEVLMNGVTHTVQAVAIPSGRRMRSGRVFTTEAETPVNARDFTEAQWAAIEDDPHLKVKPFRG